VVRGREPVTLASRQRYDADDEGHRVISERQLVDRIFDTVLGGTDADIGARRNTVWIAAVTLLADCLLNTPDQFTRERLLRGLVAELKDSMVGLSKLLPGSTATKSKPSKPKPRHGCLRSR